jgi:CRP/FNR family transcriptional regulator, cyclic AMP receptor protein
MCPAAAHGRRENAFDNARVNPHKGAAMSPSMTDQFLESVSHLPEKQVGAGQEILRQGERRGQLWVLLEGSVEIVKNGTPICTVSERGAIFGELSVLLRTYQLATVRAEVDSRFHVIEDAATYLADNTPATFVLARMLARRLALLDSHFSQVKKELEDLKSTQVPPPKEEGPSTQLFSRFLAEAERSLEGPTSS